MTSISSWSGEDDNVFAACGLDRYLRVYRTEPPQIIHKVGSDIMHTHLLCRDTVFNFISSQWCIDDCN